MCGIAGCYHINKEVDHERFEEMVDIISYKTGATTLPN